MNKETADDIVSRWLNDIDSKLPEIWEAADIPPNICDGQYVEDAFQGMEHYTNIIENGKHDYDIWWNTDIKVIFHEVNMYAYHQWKDDPALIEENRLIMTAIARIAAIVIEDNMLSVLVINGWTDDIVAEFKKAAKTTVMEYEFVKKLGVWYRVFIPEEYLDTSNW